MARSFRKINQLELLIFIQAVEVLIFQVGLPLFGGVNGYILTGPSNTVALLGDRVVLDCISTSSLSVDWHHRGQETKIEWISRGYQLRPNISDAFSLLGNKVGQFALVIDPMLISLAGRYECDDKYEETPFFAEVTVLNSSPVCTGLRQMTSKSVLVCIFWYSGHVKPELQWFGDDRSSWKGHCVNATDSSISCTFESSCMLRVESESWATIFRVCEGNSSICVWDSRVISSEDVLRVKDSNRTIGRWQCSNISPSPTVELKSTTTTEMVSSTKTTITVLIVLVVILAFATLTTIAICVIVIKRLRNGSMPTDVVPATDRPTAMPGYEIVDEDQIGQPGPAINHENLDLPEDTYMNSCLNTESRPNELVTYACLQSMSK